MKKILILFCTIILIFTAASCVLAEGTFSLEMISGGSDSIGIGGKDEEDHYKVDSDQTGKLSAYSLVLEGTAKDFKYGIEYGSGKDKFRSGEVINSDRTYDFNMVEYKFGARVLNFSRVKMDVTVSRLEIALKANNSQIEINGNLIGCDVDCIFTEKFSAQAYLGGSFLGTEYEETGSNYDESYLIALKAKFNYKVSDRMALSLGFKEVGVAGHDTTPGVDKGFARAIGGVYTGIIYIF